MFFSLNFIVCGAYHFKKYVGNQLCEKCGINSAADFDRIMCFCKIGYKRAKRKLNDYTSECYSK